MDSKDLKKIKRKELLELMLEQAKRIQELELELKKVNEELENKRIKIKESGSIAEASLKLNDVFETAQKAVEQYYENFKENCRKIEISAKREATIEKNKIIKATSEKCKQKEILFEEKLKKREETLKKLESKTSKDKTNITKNPSKSKKASTKRKK